MACLGKQIDIGGRWLHYIASGSGTPTVVFESGGGGGTALQDLPIGRLVSAFTRACIYDRPGYGWSDVESDPLTFELLAGRLHGLLEAAGERGPFLLVGSSFGGLIVRTFCRLFPGDVVGLVLVDAAEEGQYFSTMKRMRASLEADIEAERKRAETGALKERFALALRGASQFTSAEKEAFLEVVARPQHYEVALREFSVVDRTPASQQSAGGFGTLGDRPLIVLRHARPFTGEMAPWEEGFAEAQKRLAALSRNSVLITVEGAGHSIGMERPDIVAEAVRCVLAAAEGSRVDPSRVMALASLKS